MNEKWMEYAKKADFTAWAKELRVSPVTARIIRNRGIESVEEARRFLYGTMEDLADPLNMKDMEKGALLVCDCLKKGEKIGISSDFDTDGICAGEILFEGIRKLGGEALFYTPDRLLEGYGMNRRIVDQAAQDGCRLIITCDNGIAAFDAVQYAKERGIRVVVTDHHETQFREENGARIYMLPDADAVIDPHQEGDAYPFKGLCGAGVAFRLIQVLCDMNGISREEVKDLLEYVSIATIADVMDLQGENRILVKTGLEMLPHTERTGLKALISACDLEGKSIDAYHISFIIGPSLNSIGRISDVSKAFELLRTQDPERAFQIASEVRSLNETRKKMTGEGLEKAMAVIEEKNLLNDRILVVPVKGVHESVAGIVAGKIKEAFNRPVYVLTDLGDRFKGSGRSIHEYDMAEGLMRVRDLLLTGGGHKMAAGVSMVPENVELFREKLNSLCMLTKEDLQKKVWFDGRLPLSAISLPLIREFEKAAPFGTGNPGVRFAGAHFEILSMKRIGADGKHLRLIVCDGSGQSVSAVLFSGAEEFIAFCVREFGREETEKALYGKKNLLDIALLFEPQINEFRGNFSVQIQIRYYCRIKKLIV